MQDWKDNLVDDRVIHKSHALVTFRFIHHFIIIEYRRSVLFDIKYQCSATTHSHNPATTHSQTFLNLKNMHKDLQIQEEKAIVHTHTSTGSLSLSEDWHLDAELRNHNRAVEAIKCSSHTAVAALLALIRPTFTPFSHLLHTGRLDRLSLVKLDISCQTHLEAKILHQKLERSSRWFHFWRIGCGNIYNSPCCCVIYTQEFHHLPASVNGGSLLLSGNSFVSPLNLHRCCYVKMLRWWAADHIRVRWLMEQLGYRHPPDLL